MSFCDAYVKSVLSGDTLVVMMPNVPGDKLFTLAHLSAPRVSRKTQTEFTEDEPYAFPAREFLRHKVVGKRVRVRIDWSTDARHDFGTVMLNNENIAQEVVGNGWARVRPPVENRQAPDYEQLVELEGMAKAASVGMWGKAADGGASTVRQLSYPNEQEVAQLFDRIKGAPKPVCVEAILAGNMVRVQLRGQSKYYMLVLQFTGVQVPSGKVEPGQEPTRQQQIGQEARVFTEKALCQRDVSVVFEAYERDVFLGQVVGAGGHPFAEELLSNGLGKCADWSMGRTAFASQLRAAERRAKERRLRIWEDYEAPSSSLPAGASSEFTGTVIEVAGDVLVVKPVPSGPERRVTLASVRLPRRDEPWTYECTHYLRKNLIGKTVTCHLDYSRKPQPADASGAAGSSEPQPPRSTELRLFYTVTMEDGRDVGELLAREGLAKVIRHAAGEERSRNIDALLAAEDGAKKKKKNVHAEGAAPKHMITDLSIKGARTVQQVRELEAVMKRKKGRYTAVVEFCLSASRFKLFVPERNCMVVFALAGVRTPTFSRAGEKTSDPFGNDAYAFTRERVMQREVEIEVDTVDRSGAMLGYMWYERGRKNLSLELLSHGLGTVFAPAAERSPYGGAMFEAEAEAKSRNLRLWSLPREEAPAVDAANGGGSAAVGARGLKVAQQSAYTPVRVTEVSDIASMYVHLLDDKLDIEAASAKLESNLEEMRAACEEVASAPNAALVLNAKAGQLCLARFSVDKAWYRGRILEVIPARREENVPAQARVLFIDYGNSETLPISELRTLPNDLAALTPLALAARVAGITALPATMQQAEEGTLFVQEQLVERPGVRARIEYTDRDNTIYVSVEYDDGSADGADLASTLLREGLARVDKEVRSVLPALFDELVAAEEDARAARAGVWMYGDYEGEDAE